jgi:probable rRNA maturation factor
VEVSVLIDKEFKKLLSAIWLKKVAWQVLVAENARPMVEMGLVITGQEKIRELNKKYLEEDKPTDVLSFPMIEPDVGENCFVNPPDKRLRIGEVIISYPQAKEQAKEHHHRMKKEVAILIIHGVLHLLGYDHDTAWRKQVMRRRESEILQVVEEQLL